MKTSLQMITKQLFLALRSFQY